MIALFAYNLTIFWFRHVWPEIRVPVPEEREIESRLDVDRWTPLHPDLITLKEFGQLINNLMKLSNQKMQKLLELRRNRPEIFCATICLFLTFTAYLGRVNNLVLLLDTILILLILNGFYQIYMEYFSSLYPKIESSEKETEPEGNTRTDKKSAGPSTDNASESETSIENVDGEEELGKSVKTDDEDHDFVLL